MGSKGEVATLIGREGESDALRRALVAAQRGLGQVVLIEGEAGIGKTRLARELTNAAADRGFGLHQGFCDDVESARPFSGWTQAFGLSPGSPDAERRAIAELLAGDADGPSDSALSISGKQFRVVELLGALVEKLAEDRPLLLLIEDLHWADSSTLAALRSVARRIRLLPVLVVVTSRPGYERDELHRALDALIREGAAHLALGPLDAADVTSLAAELLGNEPPAELVERLEGATGNPLFVTEFVHAVAEAPEAEGVPVEFRVAVLRRIGQLSEETNDVLRLAAVLGATFAASDLAVVLGTSSLELASRLQQAISSRVVGERGARMAFRHDLVRDAIYEHIPLDLRRQLHRQVGDALAAAGADPLTVGHHLALSAESYDEGAADWLRRAARDTRLRAPAVAVALLERAVELLPPQFPDRDEYLADMVMPLAWAGRLAEAAALGFELLDRRPSPELAGALRCGLVYALTWQGRAREALSYLELGHDEVLTEADAVLLAAEATVARLLSFEPLSLLETAQLATEAEAAARATGHDLALCHALCAKAWAAGFQGRQGDAIECCREAIEVADRSAHGEGHLAHPRFFPGMTLINLDRVEEAKVVLQRGRQISEELGLVWALPLYHSHLGGGRFIAGEWDAAVAELETCLSLADDHGTQVGVVAAAAAWLTVIHVRRDDIEAAEAVVRQAVRRISGQLVGFGLLTWGRAVLADANGDVDEALALLEPAFQAFMNAGAASSDPWTAMTLVRVLIKTDNRDRAAAIAEVQMRRANVEGIASVTALGLRCRGLVDNDVDTLLAALAAYRTSGRRVDIADTLVDVGLQLIDDGRGDDAGANLDEAMEIFEDLGAQRDIARIRAELRARGVSRGTRRRQSRASSGWASLTETELKVVALVAQRLSNPEVAERLFVSRYTIESHLKNIYRKLNIGSHVELARTATEVGGL